MLIRWVSVALIVLIGTFTAPLQAAPVDFTYADLDGKEYRLSDYRGKWVFVNYWATWCPPCIEEMAELVFFHDKHKEKDAVVIGINMEDAPDERIRDFLDNHFVSYPIVLTEVDHKGPLGGVPALPTTFLVNPKGEVVHRKVGRVDLEYLETLLKGFAYSGKVEKESNLKKQK